MALTWVHSTVYRDGLRRDKR
ncbi:MAG: hypothetical protein QOI57_1589, partial [Rubrobacteraceae bacterium]|nr:hypothetical protein [Rubrobacteraceae bacterium]